MPYTRTQRLARYSSDAYRKNHREWARRDRAKKSKAYRTRDARRNAKPKRRAYRYAYSRTPEFRAMTRKREAAPARRKYKQHLDAKPKHRKRRRLYGRSERNRSRVFKQNVKRAGRPPPKDSRCERCQNVRKLRFDHDHKTDKFRGWICNACNCAMGVLGDDIAGMRATILYMQGKLPWQRKHRS